MRFYLIHPKTDYNYEKKEIHLLKNVFEAERLIQSESYSKNIFEFRQINNLTELILYMANLDEIESSSIQEFLDICRVNYQKLISYYQDKTLENIFPKDNFSQNVISELEEKYYKIKKIQEKNYKEYLKEIELENQIYNNQQFDNMLDEFNNQLDMDDEGFWRISNDN